MLWYSTDQKPQQALRLLAHVSSLNPSSKGTPTLIGRESNISSKSTNKRYHQQHAEESKASKAKPISWWINNRSETHTQEEKQNKLSKGQTKDSKRERKEEEQEKEKEDLPLTNTLGPHYPLRQRIDFACRLWKVASFREREREKLSKLFHQRVQMCDQRRSFAFLWGPVIILTPSRKRRRRRSACGWVVKFHPTCDFLSPTVRDSRLQQNWVPGSKAVCSGSIVPRMKEAHVSKVETWPNLRAGSCVWSSSSWSGVSYLV